MPAPGRSRCSCSPAPPGARGAPAESGGAAADVPQAALRSVTPEGSAPEGNAEEKAQAGSAPGGGRGQAGGAPVEKTTRLSGTLAAPIRRLARSAAVELRVDDVAAAAAQVRHVAEGAGGYVVSEDVGGGVPTPPTPGAPPEPARATPAPTPPAGADHARITVSVPAPGLDATLHRLAALGTVRARSTSTQDVTAAYADTAGRLTTARASIARVRALMARAKTVGEVIALEGALAQRESELEGLEEAMASLRGRVAESPVTLDLYGPASNPPESAGPGGFLGGLHAGSTALLAFLGVAATVTGAVLPWLVPLALLAALAWWLRRAWRSRTARRAARGAAPAAPPADARTREEGSVVAE